MTARPIDERPSSYPSPAMQSSSPEEQPPDGETMGRAVAELLQAGVLSHTFGRNGEYEVRTTLTTRQARWQYRCHVLRQGKPIKRAFMPILINHPHHMRHVHKQPVIAKAMRLNFAREAVETHFTRCAALQEYLMMAMIYAEPPLESRPPYTRAVLLISTAFLMVYGLWKFVPSIDTKQTPPSPPPAIQRTQHAIVDQRTTEPAAIISAPVFNGAAGGDILEGQVGEPHRNQLAEAPKTVRLVDLLALESPSQRADQVHRASTPQRSQGPSLSDVQVGDLLLLTGWVHRVSRDRNRAYHLQLSPGPKAAAPSLIAVVPSPDQSSASPAVRAQLQATRAFILRRMLRQQEPSPQGSVIRKPVFVQLSGQLSYRNAPVDEPSPWKGPQDSSTRWEMHPVIEVRFATPPGPSPRSRPQ
jgi:hypothetical protein